MPLMSVNVVTAMCIIHPNMICLERRWIAAHPGLALYLSNLRCKKFG